MKINYGTLGLLGIVAVFLAMGFGFDHSFQKMMADQRAQHERLCRNYGAMTETQTRWAEGVCFKHTADGWVIFKDFF